MKTTKIYQFSHFFGIYLSTSDMVRACTQPAPDRAKIIDAYARNNQYNNDQTVQAFSMNISNQMVKLNGRVLPDRQICTKNSKTFANKGTWRLDKTAFSNARQIINWSVYCSEPQRFLYNQTIKDFVKKLRDHGKEVGMNIGIPIDPKYLKSVHEVERAMREAQSNGVDFVLFILGKNDGDSFYAKIKQCGDIQFGVRTQCVTAANVKRQNLQLVHNVLLKMNAKLNGVNNIVKNPELKSGNLFSKTTMVMGADVTHPAPGDHSRPSIAAVCASMNADATIYNTAVRIQAHRQETIGSFEQGNSSHLEDMVFEHLTRFYACQTDTRYRVPKHLIYFRDGVSEGQFQTTLHHELNQIKRACKKKNASYEPTITFIVCGKRHHARLFCQNARDAEGKSQNIPAGTIVDSVITHPVEFDFYLCSHSGIQGTSRPTHYQVQQV